MGGTNDEDHGGNDDRANDDQGSQQGSRKKVTMANEDDEAGATPPAGARSRPPGWAKGLRALYDSVVEEPLPDSFMDLLSKLDQEPE